ncbi:MAG TPA: hypothetical protein VG187_11190 [Mycobacterium sp.]|nr:hypothetical protein [Mycobacterium sp.]
MSNDPAVQYPSAQNTSRSGGRQLADVIGTVALLFAHFIFFTPTSPTPVRTRSVATGPGSIGLCIWR